MKKMIVAVLVVMCMAAVADAAVYRVTFNRHWDNITPGGVMDMPNYIEPAAALANAAFGGTADTNGVWNAWDYDTRSGSNGGYNFVHNVRVGGLGNNDQVSMETLYSGDGLTTVKAGAGAPGNQGQHSPWSGNGNATTAFGRLTGGTHSEGVNGNDPLSNFTMQITGLPAGELLFYSYAWNMDASSRDDVLGYYNIALNGGTVTKVNASAYAEGSAASGVLLSTTIGTDGILNIVYTAAGFTGPGFQFATVPEPATLGLMVLGGIATLLRRRKA